MTKDLILLRDGTKLTGIRPTPHGSEAYLGIIGPGMVVVLANGEARSGRWLATFNGKPGSLELSGERVLAMGARRSCKLTFAQALE
jgi:hypothetical protein